MAPLISGLVEVDALRIELVRSRAVLAFGASVKLTLVEAIAGSKKDLSARYCCYRKQISQFGFRIISSLVFIELVKPHRRGTDLVRPQM
jgi:hypothetical protein